VNHKKIICVLICFFSINNTYASKQHAEGFVTFATENYFPLLRVLLDSVKAFSMRPIIAYGINCDIPFSEQEYPMLIKKRFDIDLSRESIYFQKPHIILDCGLQYGVYVEADDILNQDVDQLFEWAKKINKYPLCPKHPQDPNNQTAIMARMGVYQKSMPYVHGHVIFAQSCMPFVKEWYDLCYQYGMQAPNYDETILNILLWKHNAHEYAPIYDPYFESITNYYNNTCPEQHGYKKTDKLYYFMFHGCKDPVQARQLLDQLIASDTKFLRLNK
jgi:hypothetical protein